MYLREHKGSSDFGKVWVVLQPERGDAPVFMGGLTRH